ncbi:hypothetical protein [Chitinophaga sp. S165]|uniref:hypothetical protein n=1 Tax=Chitinophaga sp. S165 TaxID=2135462 RepID=UPI0013048F77|nr:hypothetical protein [Chitinophaga sp. S165]
MKRTRGNIGDPKKLPWYNSIPLWVCSGFYISISLYRHFTITLPSSVYPFDIEMTVK